MRRYSLLLNHALLVTLFLALPAYAADPNTGQAGASTPDMAAASGDDLFDLSLKEVLDLEVSTASKLSTSRTKSPGNMMVVTQDQIRRYGYRNVGEALQRVVGFVTNEVGANMQIGYRGLAPSNFQSNSRILVLVDGIRYNEWSSDQAILNERFPLDIESVDRIEVLKGAGSATWGTNALFAVVNVISKSGNSERASQVLYERQSNGRDKAYASWGAESDGGLKFYGSASVTGEYGDAGAFYPAYNTPDNNSGITRELYQQKGHRGSLKLEYEGAYANVVYGYNDERIGSGVDYNFNDGGVSDYFDIPVRSEVGFRRQLNSENNAELTGRIFHTYDRNRSTFSYPNFDNPVNTSFVANRLTAEAIGSELRYSQNITASFRTLVGAELTRVYNNRFVSDFYDVTPTLESELLDSDSSASDVTMAAYFFDSSYDIDESLTIFMGGRLDRFSGLESIFGPRLSLVYNPDDATTVRAIYSRGTRNPSLGERVPGGSVETDEVQGEKLNYYELFGEHRFGEWLSVSMATFYSDLRDTIAFESFDQGINRYQNLQGFRSHGAELEVRSQLDHFFQAYANLGYAEVWDRSRAAAVNTSPRVVSRLGVSYGETSDLIIISPELMFSSPTRSGNGDYFGNHVTANVTVVSYPVFSGFTISASIYNIFDNDYGKFNLDNPVDPASGRAGESGREFRGQLKWDFD